LFALYQPLPEKKNTYSGKGLLFFLYTYMQDYYEILGVSRQADVQTIKSAFKKLAFQYHPDRNPDNFQAEEKFKQINEAYQTLSDSYEKSLYDLKLSGLYSRNAIPTYAPDQPPPSETQRQQTYQRRPYRTQSRPYYAPKYTYSPAQVRRAYLLGMLVFFLLFGVSFIIYTFMNHKTSRIHYANAMAMAKDNKIYQALAELNVALSFDDEYADAYQKRGELQLLAGYNHKYVYSDFNKAILYSDDPTPEMYFLRGLCAYRTGKYIQAIEDCKRAYADKELQGAALFIQGASHKAMQDYSGACQDWNKAYSLGMETAGDSLQVFCQ
jgi:tetratricopeptide (TPR) repeat protein